MKIKQTWRPPYLVSSFAQLVQCLAVFVGITGAFSVALPAQAQQSGRFSTARDPNQVPTARYGRGDTVDLSLIIEEWRDRYPAIPVFVCSCSTASCGDPSVWPFRSYSRYQPFVSLGNFNAANSEVTGFNCFNMETGDRPKEA